MRSIPKLTDSGDICTAIKYNIKNNQQAGGLITRSFAADTKLSEAEMKKLEEVADEFR